MALLPLVAAAQEQAAAAGKPKAPPFWFQLLPWIAIFAIFWFLLIRPQQKQQKEREAMLARLKKNDRVVTSGGIHGVVTNVRDGEVTLKVDEANNVRIRVSRNAIAAIVNDDGSSDSKDAK
ncbi:MAG: preprotein translocase subunit YajC [Planctomycetota bacterium]|nr:MAG: preprotein translocase subunit YajC [Planctomycetota bacterium]